jgi:hypothetical protein
VVQVRIDTAIQKVFDRLAELEREKQRRCTLFGCSCTSSLFRANSRPNRINRADDLYEALAELKSAYGALRFVGAIAGLG